MALTKETLISALNQRAVTPLLLDDLIWELQRAAHPILDDVDAEDEQALQLDVMASAITNAGLSAQLDFLIEQLGSPDYAAHALNDFLNLPVVYH